MVVGYTFRSSNTETQGADLDEVLCRLLEDTGYNGFGYREISVDHRPVPTAVVDGYKALVEEHGAENVKLYLSGCDSLDSVRAPRNIFNPEGYYLIGKRDTPFRYLFVVSSEDRVDVLMVPEQYTTVDSQVFLVYPAISAGDLSILLRLPTQDDRNKSEQYGGASQRQVNLLDGIRDTVIQETHLRSVDHRVSVLY